MTMLDRCARAMDEADIGYSIRLTRLVDDEATYTATIGGETREFSSNGDANEWVSGFRRRTKARAVLEALRDPTPEMRDAADELAGTINPIDAYIAAIDEALKERT